MSTISQQQKQQAAELVRQAQYMQTLPFPEATAHSHTLAVIEPTRALLRLVRGAVGAGRMLPEEEAGPARRLLDLLLIRLFEAEGMPNRFGPFARAQTSTAGEDLWAALQALALRDPAAGAPGQGHEEEREEIVLLNSIMSFERCVDGDESEHPEGDDRGFLERERIVLLWQLMNAIRVHETVLLGVPQRTTLSQREIEGARLTVHHLRLQAQLLRDELALVLGEEHVARFFFEA